MSIALAAVLGAGCSRVAEETWPETGAVRFRGPVSTVDGESRAQGGWQFYYADGALQAEGNYVDGRLAGPGDMGDDANVVPAEGRDLWWSFYDRDGRLVTEGRFVDGRREELWARWSENGHACCTGHFKSGLPHGYHVTWNADGSKLDERRYFEGRLDGARKAFDAQGRVTWSGEYEAGQLVSATPEGSEEPPVHEVLGCVERAERGLPRIPGVALR